MLKKSGKTGIALTNYWVDLAVADNCIGIGNMEGTDETQGHEHQQDTVDDQHDERHL